MKYSVNFEKFKYDEKTNTLEWNPEKLTCTIRYKECKEFRDYFWTTLFHTFLFIFLVGGFSIFCGWCANDMLTSFIVSGVFSSIILLLGLMWAFLGWDFGFVDPDRQIEFINKNNNQYDELQKLNKIELEKCEKWREEHPFEEKVRKALESKNGNDVADVIKMILEKKTV